MSKLSTLLELLTKVKLLAIELSLDPDQISGLYGEAIALKVIKEVIGDTDYIPAPPREDNIDGTGANGTYSVKYLTPKMELPLSRERNIIHLHSSLNFDFLVVVCNTGEVFNVPREKIVNTSELGLAQRRANKMINWMTAGRKGKCAIRPTNDNWKTMMENYLVCKID